ncbi:peptide chain release factor 1 [Nesterenkonia cremea]|uniref:Peptide chain release factor 1 n=2 Tax=Nesterenkonia cremea TaxID=1882340 RepID=A0A917EP99_9MICC|nr:peptide chain release factor 1 [Nesterenkonia cremea]
MNTDTNAHMFDSVGTLLQEHQELQQQLADPDVHADQALAKKLGRRYAQLNGVVEAHKTWKQLTEDLEAAAELADEDPEFAAEVPRLQEELEVASDRLLRMLIPRDENDVRNVIIEVKGGAGGDEAALFAGDLLRMYTRYAESKGWKTEIISSTPSDLGGYKDVQMAIKSSTNDPAQGVHAHLKFEGGVHRVQRVPETESQGRIHTSAAGVLVLPEVDEPEEIEIAQNDLKIDVYRSSGPGGQSVNTTDSAVRITHLPTGIVVAMQNEKSQLQNKEAAMRVLRSRLLAHQQEQIDAENAEARKSQVRTMDRSERIRTYNFPENRIADHRTGYKAYNLDAVINGDLEAVLQSCIQMEEQERLAALGENAD